MQPTLKFDTAIFKTAAREPVAPVPNLLGVDNMQNKKIFQLDEDDETYEAYGKLPPSAPAGTTFLCCRMRVGNLNSEVIPMYWRSNIAVAEYPGGRVISFYENIPGKWIISSIFPRSQCPMSRMWGTKALARPNMAESP